MSSVSRPYKIILNSVNQVVAIVFFDEDAKALLNRRPQWRMIEIEKKKDIPEMLEYL